MHPRQGMFRASFSIMGIIFRFIERSREAFPFPPLYCTPEFSYEKIIKSYLFYIHIINDSLYQNLTKKRLQFRKQVTEINVAKLRMHSFENLML